MSFEYKHGLWNHPLYKIWNSMMERCYLKTCKRYKDYGARNIFVSDEWHDCRKFVKDMYPSYQKGLSIDRIDNNKGYSKYNCKWSTPKEQCANRRTSKSFVYNNKSYDTLMDLCNDLSLGYSMVHQRLYKYKWSLEESLSLPSNKGFRHKK